MVIPNCNIHKRLYTKAYKFKPFAFIQRVIIGISIIILFILFYFLLVF
jgi:hypothetical protein